jgi:hypothetical protein
VRRLAPTLAPHMPALGMRKAAWQLGRLGALEDAAGFELNDSVAGERPLHCGISIRLTSLEGHKPAKAVASAVHPIASASPSITDFCQCPPLTARCEPTTVGPLVASAHLEPTGDKVAGSDALTVSAVLPRALPELSRIVMAWSCRTRTIMALSHHTYVSRPTR